MNESIPHSSATVRPIAVCPICNHGGYEILRYEYENGEERVRIAINDGEMNKDCGYRKIGYTLTGRAYFKLFGRRLYLDEFIRI